MNSACPHYQTGKRIKQRRRKKRKKIYLAAVCAAIAAFTILWSIGVATDFFAQPAFSSFWWIGYETAHYIEFVALSIGGASLLLFINSGHCIKKKSKPELTIQFLFPIFDAPLNFVG